MTDDGSFAETEVGPSLSVFHASTGVYGQVGRHVGHYASVDSAQSFSGTSSVQRVPPREYGNVITPGRPD